jgi:hypothetical protein
LEWKIAIGGTSNEGFLISRSGIEKMLAYSENAEADGDLLNHARNAGLVVYNKFINQLKFKSNAK